jgi:hypothetical protein
MWYNVARRREEEQAAFAFAVLEDNLGREVRRKEEPSVQSKKKESGVVFHLFIYMSWSQTSPTDWHQDTSIDYPGPVQAP